MVDILLDHNAEQGDGENGEDGEDGEDYDDDIDDMDLENESDDDEN